MLVKLSSSAAPVRIWMDVRSLFVYFLCALWPPGRARDPGVGLHAYGQMSMYKPDCMGLN
jgi:hypothetical protein